MNHNASMMIKKVYESFQYTFSKIHIFAIFIFNIRFWKYTFIIRITSELLCFGVLRIQISLFFESPKILSYLWNKSLLFFKKGLKPTKKLNKITKQKIFTNKIKTISSITLLLLYIYILIINLDYFENLYEPKQHLSLLKEVAKFLKNPKDYLIVSHLWLNDNEIICNVGLGCESESIGKGRSYYNKNINISDCLFSRSSSYSGNGGVIYVYGGTYSMNVNYSMFYNCVCSSYGGAIFFSSSYSSLRMICANSCSCGDSYEGHFAYLQASQVNQVEYLSVSNCSHSTSGWFSIRLIYGYQRVDNTNSSMNNAVRVSSICIWSPSTFTSSHCTFSNNKASSHICIYFESYSGTISMSYVNIVHNDSPSFGVVYVSGAGSRKMMYCVFKNNHNYLFCVFQGSLEVSHSFIYHSASFSTSTAASTSNNNSFINTITYQLQFFNSLHCNADIPLPQRSLEETFRMTYERTINQTSRETIINTLNESPMNTLEQSPINTIDQTIRETLKETIPRTYAECIFTQQMANWREISVVFSFAFLYPVIILMIS